MALSGYTDEKMSLWREMCGSLRLQLKNPYLCVMFAFLTSEAGVYDGVLVPLRSFPPVNAAVTLRCAGRNVFDISMLKNT